MRRLGIAQPLVPAGQRSLASVNTLMRSHRQWWDACSAHPFGRRERQRVLDAFTTAIAIMLAPGHWASFEQSILCSATEVDLDLAQSLVGDSPAQRAAAHTIANSLWRWSTRKPNSKVSATPSRI